MTVTVANGGKALFTFFPKIARARSTKSTSQPKSESTSQQCFFLNDFSKTITVTVWLSCFQAPNPDSAVNCVFDSFIIIWIGFARSTRKQQQHLILVVQKKNSESNTNQHLSITSTIRRKNLCCLLCCRLRATAVMTPSFKFQLSGD